MQKIQIHSFTLTLLDEHWLPHIRKELPDYSENLGRLAAVVFGKYPDLTFIDIGANVGDTTAIIRSYGNFPILCIEGSPVYFELLRANVAQMGSNIALEQAFIDCVDQEVHGSIILERGTGFFRSDANQPNATSFESLVSILERHPEFLRSKMVKVDTDGMDGRIVMGALSWIKEARPVLFWEHDSGLDAVAGGPGLRLFAELNNIGYQRAMVYDNRGDYILTVRLDAADQLEDLSEYLPGGESHLPYCDICAFHSEDDDLCSAARMLELSTRRQNRNRATA